MDKALKVLKMTEKRAKLTIENKKKNEKIQYEQNLKATKKQQLYTSFNDHIKEETSTFPIDTNLLAKYKKEFNNAVAQREKLENKLNEADEELLKCMKISEEEEKNNFYQSFYQSDIQSQRGQASMAFQGSSVAKFQKTLQSTYITKSQQQNVDQLHITLEQLKENNSRVADMVEIQQDNQVGLNSKIKDIRFAINKIQKEINDYKSVKEVTERRFNDLDTRQINAIKKQKHVSDQLQSYKKEISQTKDKENQYLNDIRGYKQQLEQEIFELQDEIAGYMTQIELRNNDILEQQQEINKLDMQYSEINQKLANSNIIQDYLESFELIHKSFIKELISQIGSDIYTMDQNDIPILLEKFVQEEKKKLLRKLNKNATQILQQRKEDLAQTQNSQNEIQFTETVDRSSMVQFLSEFYEEYKSPDFVVDELIQTFKEYTILNNSLYSRYEELISLKKQKIYEIDQQQKQIDEILGNEEELEHLQVQKAGVQGQRHNSQYYPLDNKENENQQGENQQNKEKTNENDNNQDYQKQEENQENTQQQQEQKDENQEKQKENEKNEDDDNVNNNKNLNFEEKKVIYEDRHNLSKMKLKIENDANNTKLVQLAQKTQSFSFKLFFGLMECLFRYSVALKLILDQQQIQDSELNEFYNNFKQFVATFRLGFAPKREQNISYVKITNDESAGPVKEEEDHQNKIKKLKNNKRQSTIVFDGLAFQHSQNENQSNSNANSSIFPIREERSPGKRESQLLSNVNSSGNMRENEETKFFKYQESQVEKFIEVSNFIPLEGYEIINIFEQIFPGRKEEAEQFQKLIKQDLMIQFMISKQALVVFLQSKAQGQMMDQDINSVFQGFQELKQEAMVIYHNMLQKAFEYFTKFTKIMQEKYSHLWENVGEDVKRWHIKMKGKNAGVSKKSPQSQIDFNMKIINKLIEERKNPDFDRLEYPLQTKKDHKVEKDEESGKPKTSDWKKIIYKLADDSKKTKFLAEYSGKHQEQDEEENINLYDKETIEQRKLMAMDEDEFLEYNRKQLNGRGKDAMGQSNNDFNTISTKNQGKTTNNFYKNHKNESKEYLKHFLEHEKVIWSLRTLELQHKKFDSKNSKMHIEDYIPKKLSSTTNNNSYMSNTYKPRTTESTSRATKLNQQQNNFFDSKNKKSQFQNTGTKQNRQSKLNPINENVHRSSKSNIKSSQSVNKNNNNTIKSNNNNAALNKRAMKKGNKSQQLPKLDHKINNELYNPVLHNQGPLTVSNIKDNNYYMDDGPQTSKIQGTFNQESRYSQKVLNKNN